MVVFGTPPIVGVIRTVVSIWKNFNCEPYIFLTVLGKKITKIVLYQRYIFLPTFFNKVFFWFLMNIFSLSSSDYPHLTLLLTTMGSEGFWISQHMTSSSLIFNLDFQQSWLCNWSLLRSWFKSHCLYSIYSVYFQKFICNVLHGLDKLCSWVTVTMPKRNN